MSQKGKVYEFINALKWAMAVTKAPKPNFSTCAICVCGLMLPAVLLLLQLPRGTGHRALFMAFHPIR